MVYLDPTFLRTAREAVAQTSIGSAVIYCIHIYTSKTERSLFMDEGCFILIAALVVIAIVVYLVIYVVLPVSLFVLLGIGIAGALYGAGIGLYNAVQLLIEAHKTIQ